MDEYTIRLLRSLERSLNAIKQQIDAVAEYAKSYQNSKNPADPDIRHVEVKFPAEVTRKYYTEQDKTYRLQRWTFWVSVATLIALGIYTGITDHELTAMLDSNRINRESLESVQRAFVSYNTINVTTYPTSPHSNDITWLFAADMENDGTTPAISKIQEITADNTLHAEPTELEFIGSERSYQIGQIGPKGHANVGPIRKDSTFIMGKYPFTVASIGSKEFLDFFHSERVFLWGWVGYRDVFPNTMPHVTEFCERVYGIAAAFNDPTKPTAGVKPQIMFEDCAEHNCTDENCKDYQTLAAMVPKSPLPPN